MQRQRRTTQKKLISRGGANIMYNDTDLLNAISMGNDDNVIRGMLKNNANNFTKDGLHNALVEAIKMCDVDLVKSILHYKSGIVDLSLPVYIPISGQDMDEYTYYTILGYAMEICNNQVQGDNDDNVVVALLQYGEISDANKIFDQYDLSDLNLHRVNLTKCTFQNVNLSETYINECIFSGCFFYNSTLQDTHFVEVEFNDKSFFNSADLKLAEFTNCSLTEPNFLDSALNNAKFTDCSLQKPYWENCYLTDATFTDCDMESTIFQHTRLISTRFVGCNLQHLAFDTGDSLESGLYSTLKGVEFIECDLRGADFRNVEITGINFTGSNLEGALFNIDYFLKRNKVKLTKYTKNPFEGVKVEDLKSYNPILIENTSYCEYIDESPNNLLFFYEKQTGFVDKNELKKIVDKNTLDKNKIVYQCKKIDIAFVPRNENIIGGPHLNMDIFGILGVMIPLSYIDVILDSTEQIFMIQGVGTDTQMVIASLNTRLGGNVVGANHCQNQVNMKIGNVSYVPKKYLLDKCSNGNSSRLRGGTRSKRTAAKTKIKTRHIRKKYTFGLT